MMRELRTEAGFTLVEILAVVAIVALGSLYAIALPPGNKGANRTATVVQLVGLLDRAHALAAANGATLQFAPDPNGPGSVVLLDNAFSGGSTVATVQTATMVGVSCTGPSCAPSAVLTTVSLRVRRDGSFDADPGSGPVGALSVTLGTAGTGGLTDAVTVDTTDLHVAFQERT